MTYVMTEAVAATATDLDGLGSTIAQAGAVASGPTSTVLAAAGDEVSVAIANLFGSFGKEYQSLLNQATAFQQEFARTLASSGLAYAGAEALNAAALAANPAAPLTPANLMSLIIGPTGVPIPSANYVTAANNLYVRSTHALQALFTPEELYPITGVKSLPLNTSVQEGVIILDNSITSQLSIPGNTVTVFGYSQSAIIASLEMEKLAAMGTGAPTANQLNFILVGNEMNPNGGMLARFPGLSLPSLGLTFYGATPSNTIYPTSIYTLEYDGFADFPRYPLNVISDLNAVMGIPFVHVNYMNLTPAQVDSAIPLQTSAGYSGVTHYYIIPTQNLPLLDPLRAIPVIGKPLADLMQPDLKVIVNLGYGDPNYGYSTSPADVPTPFGLFPDVSPGTVINALNVGTQQGIQAFTADLQAMTSSPGTAPSFTLPTFAPPTPAGITATLAELPSPIQVLNTATSIVSTDYAVLLPTADIGLALATTMPAYDATLFFDQLSQGNLINAIGYPIAADVGLVSISAGVELLTIASAGVSNVQDIESLFP